VQEQKTEAIESNGRSLNLVAMAIQDLNYICCMGLCTDGSNHGSLKLFRVAIECFHEVHCINTRLI
jgi:hypothetical protein